MAEVFEEFVHREQREPGGMPMHRLEAWLTVFDGGAIERGYTLDDPLVQYWIKNPGEYPVALMGRSCILWGSKGQRVDQPDAVAVLRKVNRVIHTGWITREAPIDGYYVSILHPAAG